MNGDEKFRCPFYGCTLSRADCGARFKAAGDNRRRYGTEAVAAAMRNDRLCADPTRGHACAIGKQHADGKAAPDVEVRELVPHASGRRPARPPTLTPRPTPAPAPTLRRPAAPPRRQAPPRMDAQPPGPTRVRQGRRGRKPKLYRVGEHELSVPDWAKRTGVSQNTIYRRIDRGWPLEAALTTPKGGSPPAGTEAAADPKRAPAAAQRKGRHSTPGQVLEFVGFQGVAEMRVPGGWIVYVQEGAAR